MNINIQIATIGNKEVNAVYARELYNDLGMNPTHYSRWIKSQTELFVENQDFICLAIDGEANVSNMARGNRTAHLITFDMAKPKVKPS